MSTSATPNTTAGDGAPPDASLARVAIVGRPNVGKSTLLNRIIGRREAIVEERPGVTRDRHETEASWAGRRFVLIDTGGWSQRGDDLDAKVSAQSEAALDEADVILLIVDATVGSTDDDDQVAGLIRRRSTPVLVVANKVDDTGREALIWDFLGLGLGDPFPISALHGRGTGDLLDAIVDLLPEAWASSRDRSRNAHRGNPSSTPRPSPRTTPTNHFSTTRPEKRCPSRWSVARTSASPPCSTD